MGQPKRNPEYYKSQIEDVFKRIDIHSDYVAAKDYQSESEYQRDLAIGLELSQKYIDLLAEISEGLDNEEIKIR